MKFIKILILIFLVEDSTQHLIDRNSKFAVDFLDETRSNIGIVFHCEDSPKEDMWRNLKFLSFFDISRLPLD